MAMRANRTTRNQGTRTKGGARLERPAAEDRRPAAGVSASKPDRIPFAAQRDGFDPEPVSPASGEEITAPEFAARVAELLGKHRYEGAKIYYHMDLDGVASAMAMTHFLKRQGIEKFDFEVTQYGGTEFAVSKTESGWLPVLVDFAHGKPFVAVYSDHHAKQTGAAGVQGIVHAASNAGFLAQLDPSSPAFDPTDLACVDTVDSAKFAGRFTAEQVGSFVVQPEPGMSEERKRELSALVTNKLLLAIKNKKIGGESALDELLTRLTALEQPRLADVHAQLLKMLPEVKVDPPEALQQKGEDFFQEAQRLAIATPDLKAIPEMSEGSSMLVGNLAVCRGANSKMRYGGYDRYVAFRVFPEAHFQCIAWSMGLVQVSKNPFLAGRNPLDFHDFLLGKDGILSHFEEELKATPVDLSRIKGVSEVEIKEGDSDAVGFTWSDLEAAYSKEQIQGLPADPKELARLREVCDKPYAALTEDEKSLLATLHLSAWDVLMASSGGHDDISQISGLNFLPKDFHGGSQQFSAELQALIATKLKDAKLEV